MDAYVWTSHAQWKMKYYGLSKQKVTGIIRRPDRVEKGIAGNGTIAVMQAVSPKMIVGKKVWKQEVWTMYQRQSTINSQQKTTNKEQKTENIEQNTSIEALRHIVYKKVRQNGRVTIISAWRYPGVSPKNNPIPDAIWEELSSVADKEIIFE